MGEITHSHVVSGQCLARTLFLDPSRGVISLNPPGPEGSKGRWALIGARGVPYLRNAKSQSGANTVVPRFLFSASALRIRY